MSALSRWLERRAEALTIWLLRKRIERLKVYMGELAEASTLLRYCGNQERADALLGESLILRCTILKLQTRLAPMLEREVIQSK
jgi:hypothetical protein